MLILVAIIWYLPMQKQNIRMYQSDNQNPWIEKWQTIQLQWLKENGQKVNDGAQNTCTEHLTTEQHKPS